MQKISSGSLMVTTPLANPVLEIGLKSSASVTAVGNQR
jgi:hypothetical protein